jgi:hypothetical protein
MKLMLIRGVIANMEFDTWFTLPPSVEAESSIPMIEACFAIPCEDLAEIAVTFTELPL